MKNRPAFILTYIYIVVLHAAFFAAYIAVVQELLTGMWRWRDMVVFLVTFHVLGVAMSVFYHRYFTHRAFLFTAAGKWFARPVLAVAGMAAWAGPPKTWAALHERHHQTTDIAGKDPHGPIRSVVEFLYVFLCLYTPRVADQVDIEGYLKRHEPHYDWFERNICGTAGCIVLGLVIPCVIAYYFHVLVWYFAGVGMAFMLVSAVNTLGHSAEFFRRKPRWLRGRLDSMFQQTHQPNYCGDSLNARPSIAWLGGYLTAGELNHNNHHKYPNSSQIGTHWYDMDLGWWLIWTLEKAGLVYRVRRQSGRQIGRPIDEQTWGTEQSRNEAEMSLV